MFFKTITIRKTAEITLYSRCGYSSLFLPKALNIVAQLAGLLAYSIFAAFPSRVFGAVACSAKILQSLQLRVQLRFLTGFPLDTC
jgi:hypothetical protein